MSLRLLTLLIALYASTASATEISRLPVDLELAGFHSTGELTLPESGPVLAGVLLLHGATPADLDFTVRAFDGQLKSHILKDIAEHLSRRGFAVLRYNKRHVRAAGDVDLAAYGALTLADLLDDAGTALDTLAARPELTGKPVFVYGWSEGSLLAGALAARRDDIAGLILQGAVADPAAALFRHQVVDVAAGYVEQLTGTEKLDVKGVQRVFMSDAGMLVKGYAGMALDPAAGFANPRINAALDRDADGAISLRDEIAPLMAARSAAYLPPDQDFPVRPLLEQADALQGLPVLVLHGANDANVPVASTRRLAARLGEDATWREYPGLGHSLGEAATAARDDFRPIAALVLKDMSDWLTTIARTFSAGETK